MLPHSTAILSYSLLYFNALKSPNAFIFRGKYGSVPMLYDDDVDVVMNVHTGGLLHCRTAQLRKILNTLLNMVNLSARTAQ